MQKLTLASGLEIDTSTGEVIEKLKFQQLADNASSLSSTQQEDDDFANGMVARTLQDLPCSEQEFRISMFVVGATAWGLRDQDIADLLQLTIDDIREIKEHSTFIDLIGQVSSALRKAQAATVEGILMNSAATAANALRNQLFMRDADVQRLAAKDILDRAGFKAADVVNHKLSQEDAFVIHIRHEKEPKTIDLTSSVKSNRQDA